MGAQGYRWHAMDMGSNGLSGFHGSYPAGTEVGALMKESEKVVLDF